MPMPSVVPQMPEFVAATKDSNNFFYFFVVDLYLLYDRRIWGAWSCPYSPGHPGQVLAHALAYALSVSVPLLGPMGVLCQIEKLQQEHGTSRTIKSSPLLSQAIVNQRNHQNPHPQLQGETHP